MSARTAMHTLVLFDIDGTLLWTDGAGRRAMEAALRSVFGTGGDPTYRYDGKTDRQIAREQMAHAGFDADVVAARMPLVTERYLVNLERELANGAEARLLDGVTAVLDAVEGHPDAVLGLLTGNVAGGAARKLAAVGLDVARFRVNAYGSDHEHRPELPRIAQARYRALHGRDVPGERLVIIGDTPADIHCARPVGARAIGVATGRYGVDELASHAPHAVFTDLRDTGAVLGAIFG